MELKLEHVLLFLLFVFLLKMIMNKCGCKGLVEGLGQGLCAENQDGICRAPHQECCGLGMYECGQCMSDPGDYGKTASGTLLLESGSSGSGELADDGEEVVTAVEAPPTTCLEWRKTNKNKCNSPKKFKPGLGSIILNPRDIPQNKCCRVPRNA
jgi:hypothetical protein